jgi:CheY-specific phosphatase CheX
VSHPQDFGETLSDLEASFAEVAKTALGVDEVVTLERTEAALPQYQGAYLGLVALRGALQIGIASDEAGCQSLSKGLLGMGEGEPALPAEELADAFCEIVNIVAGGFKSRVRERAGSLTMGLPVFFHGPAQATGHTAVKVSLARVGTMKVALLLVYPRTRGEG